MMCHSRINNTKINRLHERCLRIIYNDKASSFENLLDKRLNFLALVAEMFKNNISCHISKISISSSIMKGVLKSRAEHLYNLRFISQFSAPLVSTVFHSTECISFLGTKICILLPENFKIINFLKNSKY